MIRRILLLALLLAGAQALAERPPNIVLLIGDDHGYPYFGFMGDETVVTPSMDALGEGGVTFSNAHVPVPYCRPSLRTMFTGLYRCSTSYDSTSTSSSASARIVAAMTP